jgi:hypothetical protein
MDGHYLKTRTGEITCPTLANNVCFICRNKGHTPKCCGLFVGGQDASPGGQDASPGGQDASPGRQDASPGGQDAAASPGRQDAVASPGRQDASPGRQDASPGGQDASPGRQDASTAGKSTTQEEAQPLSWASRAKMNRSLKIITEIESAERLSKRSELESAMIRKKAYESKLLSDKQKLEEQKAKHVENMKALYGKRWHAYVFLTENDCEEAERLREKEQNERAKFEEESIRLANETIELIKRNEASMTDDEFDKWMMESFDETVDIWEDEYYAKESEFEFFASKEAKTYYNQTGIMRSDEDFVKNGNGRLKTGLRERLQAR